MTVQHHYLGEYLLTMSRFKILNWGVYEFLISEFSVMNEKKNRKTWFKVSRLELKLACKLCVGAANEESLTSYNDIVIAIRGSLHELRHLEPIGNKMSDLGLQVIQVILDGCCHLGTLDLRECFYIDLKGYIHGVHIEINKLLLVAKGSRSLQPDDIYLSVAVYLIGDCAKKDIASSFWRFYRVPYDALRFLEYV
ncbi:hypothetical protein Tco_0780559 [Tanacetum coccineum]